MHINRTDRSGPTSAASRCAGPADKVPAETAGARVAARAAEPAGGQRRGSGLLLFSILFFAAMAIFSGWQVVRILTGYREERARFDDLALHAVAAPTAAPTALGAAAQSAPAPTSSAPLTIDWAYLQEQNSEIAGWIYCPDTVINYPVMQTTDNDYYLHHSFAGEATKAGTPFADYDAVLGDLECNYIIYGHYLRDGSMFQSLSRYKKQEYYDEHPILYLLTPDVNYRIVLISGHVAESIMENYPLFFVPGERQIFWDTVQRHSFFKPNAEVSMDYQMVTLSTCDYTKSYKDPRMLLHGMLVPLD